MEDKQAICDALAATLRLTRNHSELAAGIGKGKSSVSQYVSGRSTPKPDVQKQIADFLECSVEWLNEDVPASDHTVTGLKNVSVEQCAKMLGKSEQFVRVALQMGTAPFGFAAKKQFGVVVSHQSKETDRVHRKGM